MSFDVVHRGIVTSRSVSGDFGYPHSGMTINLEETGQ